MASGGPACILTKILILFTLVGAISATAGKYAQYMDVSRCLAPITAKFPFSFSSNSAAQKMCTLEEFSGFAPDKLVKLDSAQVASLPPSYFESLHREQATFLTPEFIAKMNREQANAVSHEAEKAMSDKCRKMLKQIKSKPGPLARGIILSLSALLAYIIFRYS